MRKPCLRKLSLMLALLLALAASASPASAAQAQLKTTQQFLDYLDSQDTKYQYLGVDGDVEVVTVSMLTEHFSALQCALHFKDDNEQVSLRIWNLVTASAGKNYIYSAMNKLNSQYKFVKFVYDENDSTIQAEMDMYIDSDHCARSVIKAMLVMFVCIDKDDAAAILTSLE